MQNFYVHPTAVVDEGAQIGEGTRIWHFCHIMPGAVIGRGCILGQNVFVDGGVVIGNGVKIQNNVSIYRGVVLEEEVFIGPSAVFTNVINPRAAIERKTEFKSTLLRCGCTVGANATIVCGVELEVWSFVGAGSVVTRNVPRYGVVYGNPAQLKGWMSRDGYPLIFNEEGMAQCKGSGKKYALLSGSVHEI